MTRSQKDKDKLKQEATRLLEKDDSKSTLDTDETSGNNAFPYRRYPDVVGVVIDEDSDRGFVQITGRDNASTKRFHTGKQGKKKGYRLLYLSEGETCMLYGNPTVLFILPILPT